MDVTFTCACGQHLAIEDSAAGTEVSCPSCGRPVKVPPRPPDLPAPSPAAHSIFCASCGQENNENNFKCVRCGTALHGTPPPPVVSDDSTTGGLIPYKNAKALWAYYLGVFSLIPCVGIPLGIAALVLGIGGLKHAKLHPDARGKGHAWTGIILGGLCALVYLALILVPLIIGLLDK